MRRNKIGALFLVSVLALAGVGVSYAGFNATITVHGTVDTGYLSYEIEGYSGSWLWKVWGAGAPTTETYYFRGDTALYTEDYMLGQLQGWYPDADYELIAFAYAQSGAPDHDVEMVFKNIFPCTWYWADVQIHYYGSIPVKVTPINWESNIPFDAGVFEMDYQGYKGVADEEGNYWYTWIEDYPIQMHWCNKLWIYFGLHMLQPANVNDFQGQTYTFSFDIYLEQWYDPCNTPPVGGG